MPRRLFIVAALTVTAVLLMLGGAGMSEAIPGDEDNDGVADATDNCPAIPNPAQEDTDADGLGDACDDDWDNDGVSNFWDWCANTAFGDPVDQDGCSLAQSDTDLDGYCASAMWCPAFDNCSDIANPDQRDSEADLVGDVCDNCPVHPDWTQTDSDADGIGDACDMCSRLAYVCIRILPLSPSPSDFVQVRLSGTSPNGCWDESASHSLSGNDINISLVYQVSGGVCDQLVIPWNITLNIGALPAGQYAGNLTVQAPGGCTGACSGTTTLWVTSGDLDGDGLPRETDDDDDNDGYSDEAESGRPVCGDGVNDDELYDNVADDGCPGGPPEAGELSESLFAIQTSAVAGCGSADWPSELASGGVPDSTNRVTITDLTSFLAPVRRLDSGLFAYGDPYFNQRWDLSPGRGLVSAWINITDLTALLAGPSGYPPMFGGARAFNGPACTP